MVIKNTTRQLLFVRIKKGNYKVWRRLSRKRYGAAITIDEAIRFFLARVNQDYAVEIKQLTDFLIKVQKLRRRKIKQEVRNETDRKI